MLQTHTNDGHKLGVYCAKPEGELYGCVIVIQEIFGVNAHIKHVCEVYAQAGYMAFAPALFDRVSPKVELGYAENDMKKGMAFMQQLKWEQILEDVEATYKLARSVSNKDVAIIGYCFGGTVAWRVSTQLKILKAAVGYYGGQIHQYVNEKPNCPVMLHCGSKDKHIKEEYVEAIRIARPEVEIYMYDADHAFNREVGASYDEFSAALAFKRTLEFLRKNL